MNDDDRNLAQRHRFGAKPPDDYIPITQLDRKQLCIAVVSCIAFWAAVGFVLWTIFR